MHTMDKEPTANRFGVYVSIDRVQGRVLHDYSISTAFRSIEIGPQAAALKEDLQPGAQFVVSLLTAATTGLAISGLSKSLPKLLLHHLAVPALTLRPP